MAYIVENDFECSDDPPSVRAARKPNPLVLISVLNEGTRLINALGPDRPKHKLSSINYYYSANTYVSGAIDGIYVSPLVAAIEACLPKNVAILLAAGADPNGILLKDLDEYSVRFIRGRNPTYNTRMLLPVPITSRSHARSWR
jgi:hypothetical protein